MKNFTRIALGILMMFMMGVSSQSMASTVAAPEPQQALSLDQKKMIFTEMKKSLPMPVTEGMVFSKAELSSSGSVGLFTFEVDPMKMGGVSIADFKKELNATSDAEMRKLVGEEFIGILKMLNIDGRFFFVYPDGTRSTININK